MKTPFDEIAEIVGVPCNDCEGAGFVILDMQGNVERVACDCVGQENEYFAWDEFGPCN